MSNVIQFFISRDDGVYTADAMNAPIVTQGNTFEELQANIQEAVALYFEGDDPAHLGFTPTPSVIANFEVPLGHVS